MLSVATIAPAIERLFGKVPISDSYKTRLSAARKALAAADYVLIGAVAGL